MTDTTNTANSRCHAGRRCMLVFLISGFASMQLVCQMDTISLVSRLGYTEQTSALEKAAARPTATNTTSPPPLLHQIAPLLFPMDAATGFIALPEPVTTVIIDVGARMSDYLKELERTKDPTVALFLFDPLPSR
jgi:hypothetical protein